MKTWRITVFLAALFLIPFTEAGNKSCFQEQTTTIKSYEENTSDSRRWYKVPCKNCNGTGFIVVTVTVYDHSRNRSKKHARLQVCPQCDGKGYTGMSRK